MLHASQKVSSIFGFDSPAPNCSGTNNRLKRSMAQDISTKNEEDCKCAFCNACFVHIGATYPSRAHNC